jgi:hypothetical protein
MILNCRRDSNVKMMRSEKEKGYLSFRNPSASAKYFAMRVKGIGSGVHAMRG